MSDEPNSASRRTLLRATALAAVMSTAGCTVNIAGYEINVGEDGGEGGTTPTPTHGYGGTPTATSGSQNTPTSEGTATSVDDRDTPTETVADQDTPTETVDNRDTPAPAGSDEYGVQGYGEYGYGGVAR